MVMQGRVRKERRGREKEGEREREKREVIFAFSDFEQYTEMLNERLLSRGKEVR